MAYTFHLLDLLFVVLAASSLAFMVWVFWSISLLIRREVRTRVVPSETIRTPEPINDRETAKERVFRSAEAQLWTPDAVSAISRRPKVETFERRFASRVPR